MICFLFAAIDWNTSCALVSTVIAVGAVVRGELRTRVAGSEQDAAWKASVDTSLEFIKRELVELREDLR